MENTSRELVGDGVYDGGGGGGGLKETFYLLF